MIARDDGALFVAVGVHYRGVLEPTRGINDELVGGKYELRTETGLERRVRDFDEPFASLAFRLMRTLRRQGVDRAPILNRCDERDRNAHLEIGAEGPWTVEIAGSVITA